MRIAVALDLTTIAGAAHAQTAPTRDAFIAVAGEGHVNVAPEFAEFFADVVTRGDSLEAATRQHTDRAAKATAALRALAKHNVNVERSSFRLEQVRGPARPRKRSRPHPNIAQSPHSRSRPISSPRSTTSSRPSPPPACSR